MIGRAGIGVDNVDVAAATKRGIIVANAPQSNIVAAAEHTIALMLALARNVPQAHASLTAGSWERSKFGGVEVYEKTLGVLGFGRIGQLVAARARAFGMRIVAYDPFVSGRALPRARRRAGADDARGALRAGRTSSRCICRKHGGDAGLPGCGGVRGDAGRGAGDQLRARRAGRRRRVARTRWTAGKVAGAALDVFPSEPITDYPLFEGYPNVVVTPHLGASTTEAQDRAGVQTAEQVVAALTGGVVSTAVNIPAISAEDMEVLGPFLPLVGRARPARRRRSRPAVERVEIEYFGRIAERDTRLLTLADLRACSPGQRGGRQPRQRADARRGARDRRLRAQGDRRARLHRPRARHDRRAASERYRVAGTTLGRRHRPHLLEAWGQRFNLQLDEGAHLALFRYPNRPGHARPRRHARSARTGSTSRPRRRASSAPTTTSTS